MRGLLQVPGPLQLMPTYTYQCPSCKRKEDVVHGIKEDFICYCGFCEGNPACVRIIDTAPGFQLKGKGWYQTDFK